MNEPFLLRPSAKDYLWGGNRLKEEFGKEIALSPLAETWECSTHPDGPSFVASGKWEGLSLIEVIRRHPQYLGTHPASESELPILIKFIDAKKDLSVQVHPDDAYARQYENGQLGKTEMWYILDAAPCSKLVYGLTRTTEASVLRRAIEEGTIENYLQKVPIKKDDVFYIEAGTIHAIGAGALIAEIQENSNLTYRLYDYHRVDQNGKTRPLHIDKALAVANLQGMSEPRQPMRVLNYQPGVARELLTRCKYFEVYRMLVNTRYTDYVPYCADELSFRVLLCVDGSGELRFSGGEGEALRTLSVAKGDCIFVPAQSVPIQIYGKAQFLDVRC